MSPLRTMTTATLAVVLGATGVLSACSSSGPAPRPSTATTSSPPVLSAALPRTAKDLAEQMRHGLSVATSAHVSLTRRGAAAVTGTMTLAAGTPTSLDLTTGTGAHSMHIVVVNSVAYARVGAATKWSPVPATGRLSAALRPVRTTLATVRATASPARVLAQVTAGRVRLLGRGTVGAVPAAHYLLIGGGTRTDLWVDGGSRPLTATVRGRSTVKFSAYGAPVHITAPASSDIVG